MPATIVHSRLRRAAATTLAGFFAGVMSLALCGRAAADAIVFAQPAVPAGIEHQLRAQLEPLLKVELSFANRACKLSDDQRRAVIAESKKWFDEFLADYAKKGGQVHRGQVAWVGVGRGAVVEDPRELIQNGIADVVQSTLPAEQSALYVEESRKRDEFQRTVAVENLVTRLDDKLLLSPEQRRELTESLTEHWDKSWVPQLEMFMHQTNMWPNVPDPVIAPHLSEAQRTMWSRLSKRAGHTFFGGMGWMQGHMIDDIDLNEVQEAADEAAKQQTQ